MRTVSALRLRTVHDMGRAREPNQDSGASETVRRPSPSPVPSERASRSDGARVDTRTVTVAPDRAYRYFLGTNSWGDGTTNALSFGVEHLGLAQGGSRDYYCSESPSGHAGRRWRNAGTLRRQVGCRPNGWPVSPAAVVSKVSSRRDNLCGAVRWPSRCL